MTLGQSNDTTTRSSGGFNSPEVYSGYSLFNTNKELPEELHACITFSYWKSFIKISIARRDPKSFGKDKPSFDMDNKLSIYIKHQKARMFAQEIRKFFSGEDTRINVGIGSGNAVIVVTNIDNVPAISIRTAAENGDFNNATYICNQRYDVIYDHDADSFNFTSDFDSYKNIEVEVIARQLEDFANAVNNAIAYSVIDNTAYNNYKLNNNINAIATKLGVDLTNKSNNAKRGYNSFNNTNSTSSFSKSTLDDLDEAIGSL